MRPNTLDDMGYPLVLGSLGAPIVYIVFGLAISQRSEFTALDLPVAVVAFATAYGFSVVVTGVFLLTTLVIAGHFSISRRITWWLVGVWPIVLGIVVGAAYQEATGAMVFAMGLSNYLLIRLLRGEVRVAQSTVDDKRP